jgi:hypothetical protein
MAAGGGSRAHLVMTARAALPSVDPGPENRGTGATLEEEPWRCQHSTHWPGG